MSLNLRSELSLRANVTATVHHGEKLEILQRHRRFAKVRTSSGAEGWIDGRQLLSPPQMARLTRISNAAGRLPAQGKITPFDLLNVHIAPNREAPSFYQMKEGELAEVIGLKLAPRVPYNPDNPDIAAAEDTQVDSWTRVRVADGRAGWVLTRLTMMAIPEEVAQYAEGHYITSYFSLGTVEDQGQRKHCWLWTTIADRRLPYHFDSFRVFVWSKRRHRYETAYIERNLRGYYPIEIAPAPGSSMASFSLIFAGRDGVLARRTYEFQGARVRMIARAPWELPSDELEPPTSTAPEPTKPTPSLADRVRSKWKQWFP
jgi:SH3-like domain-containing protein